VVQLPFGNSAQSVPSWLFTGVGAVFFVVSAAWAVRESRRSSSAVPLLALGGGFIAALEEPWIDTLIQLWYPEDSPLIVFTAMEHPQPLYVFLVYPGFVGLGSYLAYRGLSARSPGRHLWRMFIAIALLDLAFELPATTGGVFGYYGDQPLQPVSDAWPAWVAFVNAAGPVLAGWLIHVTKPYLTGFRGALAVVLIPPLAYAGTFGAAGWPTYTLLKTDAPGPALWAASLVTIGLCVAIVGVVSALADRLAIPDGLSAGDNGDDGDFVRASESAGRPS
jgi:hypothetical protein